MAKLVSVNVGLPKDVQWRGQSVFTGIWKQAVDGLQTVRRLNIDGDGQGDLAGHGGEHRAVLVYQTSAYEFWARAASDGFHAGPMRREFYGPGSA
jgi:MOSC domain-containing protein YiiM